MIGKTKLWFFKPVKTHPQYLMCSDRTVYSSRSGAPLAHHFNRQKVARAQLFTKNKRVMRTLEYLFRITFIRPLQVMQPVDQLDCPF